MKRCFVNIRIKKFIQFLFLYVVLHSLYFIKPFLYLGNFFAYLVRCIRKYLSLAKRKLLCSALQIANLIMPIGVVVLQKKQYLKIQKIHHKALKVVYNSNKNYDDLLRDNNEVLIHQSHLRVLICEVFKSLNNRNPELMWSYFFSKI